VPALLPKGIPNPKIAAYFACSLGQVLSQRLPGDEVHLHQEDFNQKCDGFNQNK
jgi:hypothetical protein